MENAYLTNGIRMPADPVLNAMWERIYENPIANVERMMNV